MIIYGLRKILFPFADGTKDLAKDITGFALQRLVSQYELRLYSPSARIPDRKILITNHVTSPFLDAMSFFPLCRKGKPMLVLQHIFNKFISLVSSWGWGGYTIDKDDKTPEGKFRTLEKLSGLLEIMKRERDLTVVIYVQGKVPKTTSETRSPERFYPGAFYLSMMSGYPILPLVSDFNGVKFTSSCRQPVYLREELTGKFIDEPDLGKFRETNRELIEEQAERFRQIFEDEYERIKDREQLIMQTKRGVQSCFPRN
jgi:1-acyl-sn-glycerol-3-phosphate acyltransferase